MSPPNPDLHRTMRTAEPACVAAVILGCAFKIMHWPGAAALIIMGGGSLALFYFPLGFRTLPAPKPTDQWPWLTWLAGAALCVAMFGLVFFMQRWPNSGPLMLSGAIACGAVALAATWVRFKHQRLDMYADGLLVRCLILGMLAFFLWAAFLGLPR